MSNIDKQALNQEKIEWLNKLADMEYCKSNPGHWLMSLKDTNMLAKLALRSVALLDELEAAEKRIAKLESNEVREDGNQFLVVRHPGKTPVIKHCTGDLEEFLRQLIEQDPLVTIDIITHRYYGVGGQWVQDAGEYLHMMSDAGIRIKGE
ncbi:ead/Ea22-like family protein [Escherichia coli]|uniref:ead/Ea22-like family protein n=1 Tax=Escherichia coli TaxID=562 RepID=UPI000E022A17|nr:ead/Ea22-like family protein [Escherichia coli]EFC5134252.1 ead/Ea22-like family protein [Escherichia coli]EHK4263278.1 ead/Ea22-like family protein [Escherichia coli]MDF7560574.1 ead/Ea22-like family protein [Escherichia coli]MDF7603279.1 ead/Ea22-like family protein [Escherichia coli]MDF7618262.1 ead/Ea22-like family protein [Escherichia coli]